jgi:hypothetical protein
MASVVFIHPFSSPLAKETVWLLTFNFIHFMAAFWAVFTFDGSVPALTAHGSLDLKQEIQIQIQISSCFPLVTMLVHVCLCRRHCKFVSR